MSNTRKDILDLLAKGKINADQAADMLSAITRPQATETPEAPAATAPPKPPTAPEPPAKAAAPPDFPDPPAKGSGAKGSGQKNWFRIRVGNLETGKNRVSVNIPMGMLNIGFKIANRFAPELEGLNWPELQQMVAEADSGLLVDVQDEDSNEHVQIYID